MKIVLSPKLLGVVELSPPPDNGTIPALQVKFVVSIMLKGYTVRVLVNIDRDCEREDIDTRLVVLESWVVPRSQITATLILSARLGSMVTLQVSVSGVVVPAYTTSAGAVTETEGVGTVRRESQVISLHYLIYS